MKVSVFPIILGFVAASLAGFVPMAASAKDQTINRTFKETKPKPIWAHASLRTKDCATKPPKVEFVEQPTGGKLYIKVRARKIKGYKGNRAKCNGKAGTAAYVVFSPKAGFNGRTVGKYKVTFNSGNVLNVTALIRVGNVKKDNSGWLVPAKR